LITYDSETGEIVSTPYVKAKRGPHPYKEGMVQMSQNAAVSLANERLGEEAYRVFFYLYGVLDYHNLLLIDLQEVGDRLGMKRTNVSRAVSKLVDRHILLRGPKVGRSFTYRINPNYAYKGSVVALKKDLAQRRFEVIEGGAGPSRVELEQMGQGRLPLD
jgi:hypothetical protein